MLAAQTKGMTIPPFDPFHWRGTCSLVGEDHRLEQFEVQSVAAGWSEQYRLNMHLHKTAFQDYTISKSSYGKK